MQFRDIARILGIFFFFFSFCPLVPLIFSFFYDSYYPTNPYTSPTEAFFLTFLSFFLTSLFLLQIGWKQNASLYRREAVATVVLIWIVTPLFSALPFLATETFDNPLHSIYESFSALTTTGSSMIEDKKFGTSGEEIQIINIYGGLETVNYTYFGTIDPIKDSDGNILTGLDALHPGLHLWRSLLQWVGGGGIVVLFVALLPSLGVGGKILVQSEITGPIKDAVTPRIKDTALSLWKTYLFFTFLEIAFIFFFSPDVPFFDSILLSFSTISTGGFSYVNGGLASYASPALEWIVLVFMVVGATNFSIYYLLLRGQLFRIFDPELLVFFFFVILFSGLSTFFIYGTPDYNLGFSPVESGSILDFFTSLRQGSFQAISALTTCGFGVVNFDLWPFEAQTLLFMVTFIGGMSGSTSAGLKISRVILLAKICQNKIESFFHPEAITTLRLGPLTIDSHTIVDVLTYFTLTIAISVTATFLYALNGIDPETSLGLVACHINNAGFAFRQAGPLFSMAFLPDTAVLLSCILMVLGRLEFFAVLVLFIPNFWRGKQ